MNSIRQLVQKKVDSYNKAEDNARTDLRNRYWNELEGMRLILESLGIYLELSKDKEFHLTYQLTL